MENSSSSLLQINFTTFWNLIKHYYVSIGERYHVNPVIFPAIHIIATPLFIASVWWIVYNHKHKSSIILPVVVAILVFNAANIYLVAAGKNIPIWVYMILLASTLLSGYFTIIKVRKRLKNP